MLRGKATDGLASAILAAMILLLRIQQGKAAEAVGPTLALESQASIRAGIL
jgi:hypothetical protein